MSVMIAIALSGILAVTVSRLLTNQAKVMKMLEVRERRMQLLRHYRDAVNAGILYTLVGRCGSGNICSANGGVLIPSSGLYLGRDLYDYGNTDSKGKWWKITAVRVPASKYAGLAAIELTVEFIPEQHRVVKAALKSVTEVILLPLIP